MGIYKKLLVFLYLITTIEIAISLATADSSEHYIDDPINIQPEQTLDEHGEQFNPEFSDSLVEKLNPSSTIEIQDKTEDHGVSMDEASSPNNTIETINGNLTAIENTTEKNVTEQKQLRCTLKVLPEGEEAMVKLINTSGLIKALMPIPNVTTGECALVMFYSPWCPFSAKAAPHFNALPRLFPHFSFFALDAVSYTALNMRYGLVAIPTVLLFHNGKPIVKYNESEPIIHKLVSFIDKYTGIYPRGIVSIIPEDSLGPIPSEQSVKIDYLLIVSWLFTITCFCWWFLKSSLCHRIFESIRNTWREAEAQHEHTD